MADTAILPWLLELLDDDSPVVREALCREMAAFGEDLPGALENLEEPPDSAQWQRIRAVMAVHQREWLRAVWRSWLDIDDDRQRLESALSLLAEFQNALDLWEIERDARHGRSVREQLDHLAGEFIRWLAALDNNGQPPRPVALELARFLFEENAFQGERVEYYRSCNSNLYHVLRRRRGLPISLALVYMLVGARAGLDIQGCGWPGHFYAKTMIEGQLYLVDAFNGICMDEETFLRMQGPSSSAARRVLHSEIGGESIIIRVLHNLSRAWQEEEEWENSALMTDLLREVKQHVRNKKRP